jgi:hypothetical protein
MDQPLDRECLGPHPAEMPFIVYGSSKEYHIDHVLRSAPNAQLTASGVVLNVTPPLDNLKTYMLTFDGHIEWTMHPFTHRHPPRFFKPDTAFTITIRETGTHGVSAGTLKLSRNPGDIFVDYEHLNEEIAADIYVTVHKDSEKPVQQIKADIDHICQIVVSLFQTQEITWLMNVPSIIAQKLATAEYLVTLGAPEISMVKPGSYLGIVSRFVGKQTSQS